MTKQQVDGLLLDIKLRTKGRFSEMPHFGPPKVRFLCLQVGFISGIVRGCPKRFIGTFPRAAFDMRPPPAPSPRTRVHAEDTPFRAKGPWCVPWGLPPRARNEADQPNILT